ncbi:hypothetical protein, variant 3 [Exophiala mesophila]|uniref:Zn(2)-C6 fungal-type domain-containing protein n=2 Tax=Exophiala mesophila TaxID=212818 RepID=A0A0D1Z4B0_EXOME|nr:hypothetical protein, variant 1 [Exophiala mesophila]XP_016220332.1 hypothetical protein, variant 2 [Exophiala mesophila]XP_016220333.1 hypothetical protein, variant 3 [Exophiala mesophila]KIV88757.1 hypothetical protein, variant 1 [Exophiala mesophila]KIV88758.1 hypothetical protein, variant 2 [Exophiala mesophila]KIV88759.1 hypothetical protein, variant 3 [Exophiala mesophila]
MTDDVDTLEDGESHPQESRSNESVPRPKRIACILCRKRKLRCDGNKPSCGTCSRLSHHCEYSEERKKSGPKRGYVKLLEARLRQVENLLETRDGVSDTAAPATTASSSTSVPAPHDSTMTDSSMPVNITAADFDPTYLDAVPDFSANDFSINTGDDFSWEMIGLGLEEALPSQDVIDELNEIYFLKIHPSMPMIHKARFLSSMNLAPNLRPPACLRYAMWAHACSVSPKYTTSAEHFYQRARKYAEADEMRGRGESMVSLSHAQAWSLIGCYEFKLMYFPRAWMSIGRATRLTQMMGLHRQDRVGLDVKQTLPPPRDWTDREERRRTFWMAYCQDRYASVGTGWPMGFDERDILTNLPSSDEAFNKSQAEPTLQLSDLMNGDGAATLSSFGGIILMSTLYGRNLLHLHRPSENDNDHDLNGPFWKRHRALDNILLNTALSLPSNLRLPAGIQDPNTVFLNMNLQTATICLHQAAIFKADKNHLPAQISAESKRRCIVAADQVTNIMKMISHLDMSLMNPFIAFCLYVAARVFVQYLKARRDDTAVLSSLHFLLATMQVLKTKNPLTESFLVQLDVDLEGTGLDIPSSKSRWKFGQRPPGESPANTDSLKCSPLFEIRQSQAPHLNAGAEPERDPLTVPSGSSVNPDPGLNDYAGIFNNDVTQGNLASGQTNPLNDLSFDNSYGFPQVQSASVGQHASPGSTSHHGSTNGTSSRSHSNHPTPSTSSNPTSSYASNPSPQNPVNMSSNYNDGTQFNPAMQFQTRHISQEFVFRGQSQWPTGNENNMNFPEMKTTMNDGITGLTPGHTGMTPMPDGMWPTDPMSENGDWMFTWPGQTPRP